MVAATAAEKLAQEVTAAAMATAVSEVNGWAVGMAAATAAAQLANETVKASDAFGTPAAEKQSKRFGPSDQSEQPANANCGQSQHGVALARRRRAASQCAMNALVCLINIIERLERDLAKGRRRS
eukprot:168268-Prymnesium_polylepis.1